MKAKANSKKIIAKSEKIINEKKNIVFHKILEHIQTNSENKISGEAIEQSSIPDSFKKLFMLLAKELKDQKETLTPEEFLFTCNQVDSV